MAKKRFDEREKELGARVFGKEEEENLMEVLRTGILSHLIGGRFTPEFEKEFAKVLGVKHAVAMTNCMAALQIGLKCAGVTAGDEVICDSLFAFGPIATMYSNAVPVFADISGTTHNMDPDKIEPLISGHTKAIIVTHAWGLPAEMDRIVKIARKHDLFIIEDCAESILAVYKGKYTGSFGHVGAYSFQASKQMSTGDGGMAVTNDDEVAKNLRIYGGAPTTHSVATLGLRYNFRMNELTAALGLAQFRKLPGFISKLKVNASYYDEAVKDCGWIRLQRGPEGADHTFYHWAATFDGEKYGISLEDFSDALQKFEGGSVFIGYTKMPPYMQPLIKERLAYALNCSDYKGSNNNYSEGLCPVAEKTIPRILLAYIICPEEEARKEASRLREVIDYLDKKSKE